MIYSLCCDLHLAAKDKITYWKYYVEKNPWCVRNKHLSTYIVVDPYVSEDKVLEYVQAIQEAKDKRLFLYFGTDEEYENVTKHILTFLTKHGFNQLADLIKIQNPSTIYDYKN